MADVMQSVRDFGIPRAIALSGVGVVVLGIFIFLSLRLTDPVMSTLYSNMSQEDAAAIATELGAMGIDFSIVNNGTEVVAPSADILAIRMMLAQKGLPNQGSVVGYEIFDRSESLGTSSFVHNVNLVRALEGELARTISSFATIKSARVHLVLPRKEMFKRTSIEPSASVVLTLSGGIAPEKEQIFAVSHLVASAVPGMKSSNVTIVNSKGKLLARGTSTDEMQNADYSASNAREHQEAYETRLKRTIESLLEKTVGIGAVKAEVSADIAFDRIVTNTENFDPDGQVARSIQSTSESEQMGNSENTVSVQTNLPAGAGGSGGSSSNVERIDEITNFEISKTVVNRVSEIGTIRRLSVAVLVDGTYRENDDGDKQYIPRTDEEMEQLQSLVRSAMGFDEGRGDTIQLVNMPFSNDYSSLMPEQGAFDWLANDLDSIVKTLIIGIVSILAILLVIRPLVVRAFEVTDEPMDQPTGSVTEMLSSGVLAGDPEAGDEPAPPSIEMSEIQSKVQDSPTVRINQIVENNPEATLDVIRGWMANKA